MNKSRPYVPPGKYDPEKLLSAVMRQKGLKNHVELAGLLGVSSATLSEIKFLKLAPSPKLLRRIQVVSRMSMREMRDLMDNRRHAIRMAELVDSDRK